MTIRYVSHQLTKMKLRRQTFLNCKLVLQWNNFLKNKINTVSNITVSSTFFQANQSVNTYLKVVGRHLSPWRVILWHHDISIDLIIASWHSDAIPRCWYGKGDDIIKWTIIVSKIVRSVSQILGLDMPQVDQDRGVDHWNRVAANVTFLSVEDAFIVWGSHVVVLVTHASPEVWV